MHACMHVYVLKVPYNKEKFLTSIVYHMCMHVCMGVHHMCICLKVSYIRRNSLQINYGVQFYCVSHVGACASHVCMPESSLHKEKFLTIKLWCPILLCITCGCASHVCMPESSLHKEKFLTNKILVSALCIIIHACMHVHGCACITCVYMF